VELAPAIHHRRRVITATTAYLAASSPSQCATPVMPVSRLLLLPASFRLPAVDRDAIEVNRLSHHRSWTWLVGGRNAHAPGRRSSRRDY